MIKIMHVVHSLNEGGLERLLLELCKKIDRDKFEIQICCLVEYGELVEEFRNAGIKIFLLNAKREFSLTNIFINFFKLFELRGILIDEGINATHGHEFFSTVFSRLSSLLAGLRWRFITLHNMYYWWSPVIHFMQRLLALITTKIVCNSVSTYIYSLENDKINKNKYKIIFNGIDTNRFRKLNGKGKEDFLKSFNVFEKSFVCMSVGNISERKGYSLIIEAADILRNEFSDMVYFLVGGRHHMEYGEYVKIKLLIEKMNLSKVVFITGRRNDVDILLNFCDLFLMPSLIEGFGISLVEALSMGKICIASDIAPFKEILDNNTNGFIFEKGNGILLSKKIRDVRYMPTDELNRISRNARIKVMDNFSSDVMVKKYEELYLTSMSKSL